MKPTRHSPSAELPNYKINLWYNGNLYATVVHIDDLEIARDIFPRFVEKHKGYTVTLQQGARVILDSGKGE